MKKKEEISPLCIKKKKKDKTKFIERKKMKEKNWWRKMLKQMETTNLV